LKIAEQDASGRTAAQQSGILHTREVCTSLRAAEAGSAFAGWAVLSRKPGQCHMIMRKDWGQLTRTRPQVGMEETWMSPPLILCVVI